LTAQAQVPYDRSIFGVQATVFRLSGCRRPSPLDMVWRQRSQQMFSRAGTWRRPAPRRLTSPAIMIRFLEKTIGPHTNQPFGFMEV
jgi:hypothetical protein